MQRRFSIPRRSFRRHKTFEQQAMEGREYTCEQQAMVGREYTCDRINMAYQLAHGYFFFARDHNSICIRCTLRDATKEYQFHIDMFIWFGNFLLLREAIAALLVSPFNREKKLSHLHLLLQLGELVPLLLQGLPQGSDNLLLVLLDVEVLLGLLAFLHRVSIRQLNNGFSQVSGFSDQGDAGCLI